VTDFVQSSRPSLYLPAAAAALGLGLLTTAYFVTFLPALVFVVLLKFRGSRKKGRLVVSITFSSVALMVIAGAWHWRMRTGTGAWFRLAHDVATEILSRTALLGQAFHVNWKSGLASIWISHVWFGGWSFLRLPNWIYVAVLLLVIPAVLGIAIYTVRWFRSGCPADALIATACFYLCFCLGLCYQVLVTYVHLGVAASNGWYLYCLVFAEAALLVKGSAQVLGQPVLGWFLSAGITVVAIIDLFGMHLVMLPYYSGLIAHTGEQVLPYSLRAFSAPQVFDRLALLTPNWLDARTLQGVWIAYLLATVLAITLAWFPVWTLQRMRVPHARLDLVRNRK
jgi:hypothetical protein